MNLINQIKQHLSQANITQAQLAREAGINAGALSAYLSQNYKEALKVMQSITETGGGLRILTQTLRLAGMVAKGSGKLIDADLIIKARQELLGKNE